jgi:hypothetical protein
MKPYLIQDDETSYNDAALQCRLKISELEYTHQTLGAKWENLFMTNLRTSFWVMYPKSFVHEGQFHEALLSN